MTSTSFRVLVLWLVVATARVLAQGPPDFSGQWKLDQPDSSSTGGGRGAGTGGGGGQGGGLGLGPSAENLTITQTATSLTIEERWASGGSARRVYPLDGRQANNTLGAGRGPTATVLEYLDQPQAGHDAGRDVQRLVSRAAGDTLSRRQGPARCGDDGPGTAELTEICVQQSEVVVPGFRVPRCRGSAVGGSRVYALSAQPHGVRYARSRTGRIARGPPRPWRGDRLDRYRKPQKLRTRPNARRERSRARATA